LLSDEIKFCDVKNIFNDIKIKKDNKHIVFKNKDNKEKFINYLLNKVKEE